MIILNNNNTNVLYVLLVVSERIGPQSGLMCKKVILSNSSAFISSSK